MHTCLGNLARDYFFDNTSTVNGGNRAATVLIYLNDVEEGGETVRGGW